jgi:hypothetical protein
VFPDNSLIYEWQLLIDILPRDHLEFKKSFFEKRQPVFTDTLSENAPRTYPWWNELSVETRPKAESPRSGKL